MASKIDDAFFFVICDGVRCDSDDCELAGNGCAFGRTDKKDSCRYRSQAICKARKNTGAEKMDAGNQ